MSVGQYSQASGFSPPLCRRRDCQVAEGTGVFIACCIYRGGKSSADSFPIDEEASVYLPVHSRSQPVSATVSTSKHEHPEDWLDRDQSQGRVGVGGGA